MSSRQSRRMLGGLVAAVFGLLVGGLPAAAARDRIHDRIPDRWEKRHHLSLHKKQAKRNQDHDGLKNRQEWKAGDDPRDPDSDNGGGEDGDEGAGTISSFQDHVLPIDLFGGGSISGLVTEATRIECDHGDDQGDEDGDDEGGHHGETGESEHHGDQGDDEGQEDEGEHAVGKSSSDDEPGDDEGPGEQEEEDDDHHACSTGNLAPGGVV